MKIALGSIQCESNTFNPIKTREEDFDRAFDGEMLSKIHVTDMLIGCNADIIPTLYAHALPGGPLVQDDFIRLAGRMVDSIPAAGLDGVWLYLHGAMFVDEIGSGEAYILRRIREKIGFAVPISICMDFHANNCDEIFNLANVICGFRTAPHVDRIETERKAMRLLLRCIDKHILPRPQFCRAPVMIPGDAVLTSEEPLKGIMALADEMEKLPGMLCAQVFNGQPWVDVPYVGPNMVVTHEEDQKLAKSCAEELALRFYDVRHQFRFLIDAFEPDEAIQAAHDAVEHQVFISDSGDNITAGAAGDNAFMLNRLIKSGYDRILVAGIADKEAVDACYEAAIGDTLSLSVGGRLDSRSERAFVTGKLISMGDILGYEGDNAGPSATIDAGNITLIITRNRAAITSMEMFDSIGMDISGFKIVVVKLGYLFPGLASVAPKSILAFTPGGSAERLQDIGLRRITRPVFPLDDDFIKQGEW